MEPQTNSSFAVFYLQEESVLIHRLFEGLGGGQKQEDSKWIQEDSKWISWTNQGSEGFLVISVIIIALVIFALYILKLTLVQLQKCFRPARPQENPARNTGM